MEERLFALRAEARKHGVTPDELSDYLQKVRAALDDIELGEAAFDDLRKKMKTAKAAFNNSAASLSKDRRTGGEEVGHSRGQGTFAAETWQCEI